MSFSYAILSEQEAMSERYSLLKEGSYDAVISASLDKTSANSGNPMMDLTLTVYDKDGKEHSVRDFLVFTPKMMWKVVHFATSTNLLKEYEEGKLCSEIAKGCRAKVKVTIESGSEIPQDKLNGKPIGSKYPDKNKIDDYLKRPQGAEKEEPAFQDDDLPF